MFLLFYAKNQACSYLIGSTLLADLLMMAGAILIGYVSCLLQQGLGSSLISKMKGFPKSKFNEAVWPSFGQLIRDLPKVAMEALSGVLAHSIPSKDSLVMPEDETEPAPPLKQRTSETRQVSERPDEAKLHKLRSTSTKDPSLSTKHRSSRRQEYAELYGSSEAPQHRQVRSKGQKERSKHRHRERGGDATFGATPVVETKPGEAKPTGYENTKYDPYNFRSKYGGDSCRFD
ncbi:hypothetical protein SASPL_141704 [Salvia splendens]|uniref:Uncharacterized protein n=1 Tax=Salvia splendens TaxID=180675 RepID=A0A8X8WKI6_SALSN|nr:hypothetical protein SASPL_141704 [Salvia splendens]